MSQVTSFSNSALCHKAKKILKEMGYEVKTTHLHKLFAELSKQPTIHHASAKKVSFAEVVLSSQSNDIVASGGDVHFKNEVEHGKYVFDVEIKGRCDVAKLYRIAATDEVEAKTIIKEYIKLQSGAIKLDDTKFEETRNLFGSENYSDFSYANWETSESVEEIEFSSAHSVELQTEKLLATFQAHMGHTLKWWENQTVREGVLVRINFNYSAYELWVQEPGKDELTKLFSDQPHGCSCAKS